MDHTLAAPLAFHPGATLFFRNLLDGDEDEYALIDHACADARRASREPDAVSTQADAGDWWHREAGRPIVSANVASVPDFSLASNAIHRSLGQSSLGMRQPDAARLTAQAHVRARHEARDLRDGSLEDTHRRIAGLTAAPALAARKVRLRWGQFQDMVDRNPLARPIDVVLAATMLVVFAPLMALVALVVWAVDPGPVIFAHRRVGHGGRSFPCYKFRSMYVGAEQRLQAILAEDPELRAQWERDHKLPDDPRVTRIGRILRATSLDELPQLVNVLRGDMSLVGPRPIVKAETRRYGRYLRHYLAVRPGLTGLWQVSGRSETTYRRRVAADVHYTRRRTFGFDIRILAATLPAVLAGKGSC